MKGSNLTPIKIASTSTLLLSHLYINSGQMASVDWRLFPSLFAIYWGCYWLRGHFYDDATTFFDVDQKSKFAEPKNLLIFGDHVANTATENKERQLLFGLSQIGVRTQVWITFILAAVLSSLVQYRFHPVRGIELVLSAVSIGSILTAAFAYQLLLPIFLSLILTLLHLIAIHNMSNWGVDSVFFVYLSSFLITFLLFWQLIHERLDPTRELRLKKHLKPTLLMAAIAIGLYQAINWLVPETNPFSGSSGPSATTAPSAISKSNQKLIREFAKQIQKHTHPQTSPEPSSDLKTDESTVPNSAPNSNQKKSERAEPSVAASKEKPTDADLSEPSESQNPKVDTSEREVPPRRSNLKEDAQQMLDDLGKSKPETGDIDPKSQETSQENSKDLPFVEKKADNFNHPKSTQPEIETPKELKGTDEKAKGTTDASDDDGASSPSAKSDNASESRADQKQQGQQPTTQEDTKSEEMKLKELENKLELSIDIIKGLFFLALAGALVLFLSRFVSSQRTPQERKVRRQQLNENSRKIIQSILSRIREQNLSVSQEIVETYNALLKTLELGQYPRPEWMPAEDFSDSIGKELPLVRDSFSSATIRFSQTLYGLKDCDSESLRKFRNDADQVLRFFSIRVP